MQRRQVRKASRKSRQVDNGKAEAMAALAMKASKRNSVFSTMSARSLCSDDERAASYGAVDKVAPAAVILLMVSCNLLLQCTLCMDNWSCSLMSIRNLLSLSPCEISPCLSSQNDCRRLLATSTCQQEGLPSSHTPASAPACLVLQLLIFLAKLQWTPTATACECMCSGPEVNAQQRRNCMQPSRAACIRTNTFSSDGLNCPWAYQ